VQRQLLLALFLLAFLCTGCSNQHSLVGTWTSGRGNIYTFDDSSHVKRTDEFSGTIATYTGTYKLSDSQLSITMTDGSSMEPNTDKAAKLLVRSNPISVFGVKWLSSDTVELKSDLAAVVFKRQD
jgi:hypothetical protein